MFWRQELWQQLLSPSKPIQDSGPPDPELITPLGTSSNFLEKKQRVGTNSALYHIDGAPDLMREPTIIILPGGATINKIDNQQNRNISGTAKYGHAADYKIYGMTYSSSEEFNRSVLDYIDRTEPKTLGWSNDVQDLLEKIIQPNLPLLHDLAGEDRASALIDCFHSFRNLKIFGYSHGGLMTAHFNNGLNSMMEINGFLPEECTFLIPQIMAMNVASIDNIGKEGQKNIPAISCYEIKALNDTRLADMFDTFSHVEETIEKNIKDDQSFAKVAYGDNQICFYANHHPDKMGPFASRYDQTSHDIATYLDKNTDLATMNDPFPIIHDVIWQVMTDTRHIPRHTNVEQNRTEQWQFIQDHYRNPMQEILSKAEQNPDYRDCMTCTRQYKTDDGLEQQLQPETSPDFSVSLKYPINYHDLSRELSYRTDQKIVDFLLSAPFVARGDGYYKTGLPDWLSSPKKEDNLNQTSRILFNTCSSKFYADRSKQGRHETTKLCYRGIEYMRYLAVDAENYHTRVIPLQQRWQQNTEKQNLMSIVHDINMSLSKDTQAEPIKKPSIGSLNTANDFRNAREQHNQSSPYRSKQKIIRSNQIFLSRWLSSVRFLLFKHGGVIPTMKI